MQGVGGEGARAGCLGGRGPAERRADGEVLGADVGWWGMMLHGGFDCCMARVVDACERERERE